MLGSLIEFDRMVATDQDCYDFIYKLKWPAGFRCPRCDHSFAYTISTRNLPLYECRDCKHQTTLTTGTMLNKSRTSLRKWLQVLFVVSSTEESINAVQLADMIQVTYKTAWTMLNKIRMMISEYDRSHLLTGFVEAKLEVYMKQPLPTMDSLDKEQALIAASSTRPNQAPYFKIKLVKENQNPRQKLDPSVETGFIKEHVSPDLLQLTINRHCVNLPQSQDVLPQLAQSAFHWLNRNFHGLSLKYSQAYLDEYCYRKNVVSNANRSSLVHLLTLCLAQEPPRSPVPNWSDHELAAIKKIPVERSRIDWSTRYSNWKPADSVRSRITI
ncbi:IS1595 family transposase [Paenibacillus harenae]|uniref:IS1595 family transposase n=1 Tax=Paenibacillus harenae TaxID=306543 RepID=UPI00278DF10B|nr:IS1595 family transposase [Paenibacillus harenae]MDQ0060639.1 transposase-like protein [Paenibacillus harenae]